jgi:phosphoribosylamine--glycine ligase
MKILVIGSGGREHALVWALARSRGVSRIYSPSHNAGILELAQGVEIDPEDLEALADFAARERIDLIVVGPEGPLVGGLTDRCEARGLSVFGPSRAASRLEGSKVFAKEFMARHGIPSARYRLAATPEEAHAIIDAKPFADPLVIKAEGLAGGKGVILAEAEAEAHRAVEDLMVKRTLGEAGARLVIEDCLVGRELSYLVFADGESYSAMPVAQDHKRAEDGDRGPNTGGMGAFSVPGLIDVELERRIKREIIEPTLAGARQEGMPFRGVLYCGLMLTAQGPQVLEYNVRLGDPETQAILRRLDSDLAEICLAVARGALDQVSPRWSDEAATCVVIAAAGYPGRVETGQAIAGLEAAAQIEGVVVFQAGTRRTPDGDVVTNGGRVLGVTARGATLDEATARVYAAVDRIGFEGAHCRRDIGRREKSSGVT